MTTIRKQKNQRQKFNQICRVCARSMKKKTTQPGARFVSVSIRSFLFQRIAWQRTDILAAYFLCETVCSSMGGSCLAFFAISVTHFRLWVLLSVNITDKLMGWPDDWKKFWFSISDFLNCSCRSVLALILAIYIYIYILWHSLASYCFYWPGFKNST